MIEEGQNILHFFFALTNEFFIKLLKDFANIQESRSSLSCYQMAPLYSDTDFGNQQTFVVNTLRMIRLNK
jgi:hypothetical protein